MRYIPGQATRMMQKRIHRAQLECDTNIAAIKRKYASYFVVLGIVGIGAVCLEPGLGIIVAIIALFRLGHINYRLNIAAEELAKSNEAMEAINQAHERIGEL